MSETSAPAEGTKTYQLTLVTGPSSHHRFIKDVGLVVGGAALTTLIAALRRRLAGGSGRSKGLDGVDITSKYNRRLLDPLSKEIIDSREAIDTLICSHYLPPAGLLLLRNRDASSPGNDQKSNTTLNKELGGYLDAQQNFAVRVGILAERFCPALRDFTGERGETSVLDIGCSVGATSFELCRSYQRVYGCDPSIECIHTCQTIKLRGWMRCNVPIESDLYKETTVSIDESVDRNRAQFAVVPFDKVDTTTFPEPFDAVVCTHTLSRMEDPKTLLSKLFLLVAGGGIAVISSSFDWSESTTPRCNWLGGYTAKDGNQVGSLDVLKSILGPDFDLVSKEDFPAIVRDNERRLVFNLENITVWRKK